MNRTTTEQIAQPCGSVRRRSRPLRLGTRGSVLALRQARHVAGKLGETGCKVAIVEIATSGDRDLARPIGELPSPAPFADDLEEALRQNEIDIAVHSLKDLSVALPRDLAIAAVLERGDPRETIVSTGNVRLAELPFGAVVGTSSPRRAAQLRHLRADLRVAPIRGPVDDRVRQVRRGEFDAAILAAAGLERLDLLHEAAEILPLDLFLPAPAQGVLAVQVRTDDWASSAIVARLDHVPTRRAVAAELAFLRPFESRTDLAAAAVATGHPRLTLHARILRPSGEVVLDVRLEGDDPGALAAEALIRAARVVSIPAEETR